MKNSVESIADSFRKIKYLGITPIKQVRDLYSENFTILNTLKKKLEGGKTFLARG